MPPSGEPSEADEESADEAQAQQPEQDSDPAEGADAEAEGPKPARKAPTRRKKTTRKVGKKTAAKHTAKKRTKKEDKDRAPEPISVEAAPHAEAAGETGRIIAASPEHTTAAADEPAPEPREAEPRAAAAAAENHAWGMACHLATLITFATPLGQIGGVLAPIVIWQFIRKDDAVVDYNAKEAFNFQANLLFWFLVGLILSFTCILSPIGIVVLFLVPIANVVLTLLASYRTANGERFRYPWIYRLLKTQPA